jgi:hypothetical protein
MATIKTPLAAENSPPSSLVVSTTTETTVPSNGGGGTFNKFLQFGNMPAMAVIQILFAFIVYFVVTNNSTSLKEKIADDRDERNYQRMKHDQDLAQERATHEKDMILLTAGMTKNTENTATLINELKVGREAIDRQAAERQTAFERRTEQQHLQIKELHDILLKKSPDK